MSNPNPLNQFKKGVVTNPNGRPPNEWTWKGLIKEQLERIGNDGRAVKEAVSASLIAKALEGDVVAIKEIGNRIDGMPEQSINSKGKIELTYKPIMGATANVPEDPRLPEATETNEAD